jgi:putative endonuclease
MSVTSHDRKKRGRIARRQGHLAELACRWLLRLKGYSILAHGHVTGRGTGAGEIDIIAKRGRLLAFIEVKIRAEQSVAATAITRNQRHRLTRAAAAFVAQRSDLADCAIRFDAMLLAPWRWPCHLIDAWRDQG